MAEPSEIFDAVLIGAGQANNPLARSLAGAGRRVALIERAEVGGTCVNTGCTPTKTMAASARIAHLARRAGEYGVHTGAVLVRLDEVRDRARALVDRFRSGSERKLAATDGLELIRGEGSFIGPRTVRAALHDGGARTLCGEVVVIDTGCRPSFPDVPGLGAVAALDSTSILGLGEIPEHLLVLGGGYIGVEFAQMFRRFGSRVTLVQKGGQLLRREDPDMAAALAEILREDGIDVVLDARATQAAGGAGEVRLSVWAGGRDRELAGSHLLVTAGRTPNTEALNMAAAGVRTDARGFIPVDERLETNVAGVYAVGDVNGGPAFTHVSHHDNQILRENLLRDAGRTTAGRLVPFTVFTDPQFGRVGLTEREVRAQGRPVRIAKLPMAGVARALEAGEARGILKAVVDARTDLILGCAALGVEGGEIMSMVQLAMMGGLSYQRLRDDMFAHPTLAEGLNNLFASFEGE
ncbi:mercuric reductase [Paludisphaera mucosa]|uniref:Mercuric reductase n=1 Tax=Paludisphaera mucosa TaxID=3030827 RepID=A0ABT6FEF2_9BACT|nr:mercuric reductase [Paludisphaera mucosa]MDG3005956.1 mercuric reductase [Paludisphaera mucosa]